MGFTGSALVGVARMKLGCSRLAASSAIWIPTRLGPNSIPLTNRVWLDKDGGGYKPLVIGLDIQGTHYQQALEWAKQRAFKAVRAVRGLGADKRKSTRGGPIIPRAFHHT